MKQKHFLFCGPSGSGKTSIVKHLLEKFPFMRFSVSCTTRPKRATETQGADYYFLTPDEFRKKIDDNEFLEWEEVYTDRYYGTLKSEVERIAKQNNSVIFDVDVEGGLNIKKHFTGNLLAVMVMPPSVEELHKRLIARNTETEETLKIRIAKAEHEMSYRNQFDHVIVNDDFDKAISEAEKLVNFFITA
ncbi:MAG TPA: guanylate kinase [Bacteroidia bacterium]|nr:guanylate kinase [Bacteroidia bacterium]HNU32106.1 guanylate kinase [Bacteroidia bacterium]